MLSESFQNYYEDEVTDVDDNALSSNRNHVISFKYNRKLVGHIDRPQWPPLPTLNREMIIHGY